MATAKFESPALLAIKPEALAIAFTIPASRGNRRVGAFELVDIQGPLTAADQGLFDSYESIKARVQQACLGDASTVVLNISSPGGEVHNCFATARDLRSMCAAAGKGLLAFVDEQGCSAAYAIATAASTIVASETSTVGSIGVIMAREDYSEMLAKDGIRISYIASGSKKAFGSPEIPESDAERMDSQRQINNLAAMFFSLVEAHRGIPATTLALMEAGTFIGQEAVKVGLVDRVASLESILTESISSPTEGATDELNTQEAQVTFAEICDALAEMAKSEAENAKQAAAMLAALEEQGPGDEDEESDDAPEEPEEDKGAKSEGEEEDKEASASVGTAAALAKQLEKVVAENHTLKVKMEASAKADFFATHQVSEQLREVLESKSLTEIQAIVAATQGKPGIKAGLGTVKTTQGPRPGSPLSLQGKEREKLDIAMGVRAPVQSEESTSYRQVFSRLGNRK